MAWTPPPNWPAPPNPGWAPPPGWQPDPAWGPAPAGWNFYPAGPALPELPRVRMGSLLALAGVVLAIIGSVGTWVHVSVSSFGGLNGSGVSDGRDGTIVIVLAVIGAAFAILRLARPGYRWPVWIVLAMGVIILITCFADIGDVHNKVDEARAFSPEIHGGVGWGLWLSLVSGFVILGGAAAAIDLRRAAPPAISPTPGVG